MNQSDYYAIITLDPMKAAQWFQNKYHDTIKMFIRGHMMFEMKNGDKYRIISRAEQLVGYHFVDLVVDPTYTDLLTEARKKLR
jgi:hypothetical protein